MIFPVLKKKLKSFFINESGSISKNSLLTLGSFASLAALAPSVIGDIKTEYADDQTGVRGDHERCWIGPDLCTATCITNMAQGTVSTSVYARCHDNGHDNCTDASTSGNWKVEDDLANLPHHNNSLGLETTADLVRASHDHAIVRPCANVRIEHWGRCTELPRVNCACKIYDPDGQVVKTRGTEDPYNELDITQFFVQRVFINVEDVPDYEPLPPADASYFTSPPYTPYQQFEVPEGYPYNDVDFSEYHNLTYHYGALEDYIWMKSPDACRTAGACVTPSTFNCTLGEGNCVVVNTWDPTAE